MKAPQVEKASDKKFFIISLVCHLSILAIILLGFDYTAPLPVIQNTNQHDIISAVVLGDTPKSKIVKEEPAATPPVTEEAKKPEPIEAKPEPKPERVTKVEKKQPDDDAIALEAAKKKKLAAEEARQAKEKKEKELRDSMAKSLMADIMQEKKKQKKIKQKALQTKFEKMLKQQAEQSLRQQLLDEEIKLKGTQSRMAQGVVDKYKALIVQAISENWIVPTQANKKLYSELMIRIAPGGMVLDVQITKSSGDKALDSSARAAVMKSSPLPVPKNANEFEPFRQFVLKVRPENIVDNRSALGNV